MNISVFGLGYVGSVTAACLAQRGHSIIGVDVHPQKVQSFNDGLPPIVEPGLAELLTTAKDKGLLRATIRAEEAICDTELSIVCVGTPSKLNGALDLGFVRGVVQQIRAALDASRKRHILVLRSTMLPGSTEQIVGDLLSNLVDGGRVEVLYYPEFLREGSAVRDFDHPSLVVVGTRTGEQPPAHLRRGFFEDTAVVVDWATAEMVKYACNAFHATKVVFANEIGRVGKDMGLDARAVMELLCHDTKLNLSPYYMKPGNPFGGSCLGKDVRALTSRARAEGLHLPLLENLLPSNERHLQSLLSLITEAGEGEVCILGLSFKSDTDDLREAPMVEVAQTLLGRGYKVRIYDPSLNLAALVGANKRVIDARMPHLASLLQDDLATAVGQQGLIVAAQPCVPIAALKQVINSRHRLLDVNGWPELRTLPCKYEGFCW
jgi:GDP-mannose 6-dehydrogenase